MKVFPIIRLFVTLILLSLRSCRRVRLAAKRGEIPGPLGPYAVAFEASLVAFIVGGSFVSFQYCEMLWHYLALTIALERIALAEAANNRAKAREARLAEQQQAARPAAATEEVPDFAWA